MKIVIQVILNILIFKPVIAGFDRWFEIGIGILFWLYIFIMIYTWIL